MKVHLGASNYKDYLKVSACIKSKLDGGMEIFGRMICLSSCVLQLYELKPLYLPEASADTLSLAVALWG